MGARVEKHYPWIGGLACGLACYWALRDWTIPPGTKDLLTSFLNVAAIMIGFLVTGKSILISLDETWIIQKSKTAGAYEMLVGYMVAATYWWFAMVLLSAIGVAMIPPVLQDWQRLIAVRLFSIWIFIAVSATLSVVRILAIYSTILRAISKG